MTKLSPKELVQFTLYHGGEDDLRAVIDKLLYVVDYDAQVALSRIVRDTDVNVDLRAELAGRLSGDVALIQSIVMEPKILDAIRGNGFASDDVLDRIKEVEAQGWADVFTTEYLFSDKLDWGTIKTTFLDSDGWDEFYSDEVLDRLVRNYWSVDKNGKAILDKAQQMVLVHAWKVSEDNLRRWAMDRRHLESIMSREDLPLAVLEQIWENNSWRSSIQVEWYTISKNTTAEFLSEIAKKLGNEDRSRIAQSLIKKYTYG